MRTALLLAALHLGASAPGAQTGTPTAMPAARDTPVVVTVPSVQDTVLVPDSADLATAYADSTARVLVRLARGQRDVIDASVFHYTARTHQRVSVGIRALRRDRLLYRREVASTVDWRRDGPSRVEVQGAREAVPVAIKGLRVPDDLADWARDFVPQPGTDQLFVDPQGGGFAWHPLVQGGEALYRYATGDTTVIRLPDRPAIRLVELRVTPRRRDVRLVTGSFWIDLDTHAIVQAVFRPARDFDLERDLPTISPGDASDIDDVPGLLKPIRFEIRYITVEYSLWEMRWWMPRLMAFDGYLQMGMARFPIKMEIVYDDYRVEADRYGLPELPPVIRQLAGDSTIRPRPYHYPITVDIPADSAALLDSPALAASFYASGETLISEREIRELGDRLGALPAAPWEVGRPRITPPWTLGRGLLRYNRVEGLSVGARADWDLTRLRLDLTGRFGLADREPEAVLGVDVPTLRRTWRLTGYHRLASMDPAMRPFGLANSANALLFGRDDGLYYRTTGVAVSAEPAPGEARYTARLYWERQRPAERTTDFSLRHALNADRVFRPNPPADAADQVGVAVALGVDRGLDPNGFRWGAWLDLTAETGTYTFLRPGLTLHAAAPLPGRLVGALEVAGGTTVARDDAAPLQSSWFLGGPPTLRGFRGGAFHGPDYTRARVEVANDFPAARLALFSDAGWTGRFEAFRADDAAVAVGAGASLLDGLLRVDLARTLRPVQQWRVDLYVDALF